MAISQDDGVGPSAESLALAASVFTSQISSWIPANFGRSSSSSSTSQTKPVSNAEIVFQAEHERGERLGLGHPLLEVPRHQRRQDTSSSLTTLGKRLGLDAKGKGKAEGLGDTVAENEDEEEEESRASIGKRRKVDKVDVWSGKKKAKTKAKAATLEPVPVPSDQVGPSESTIKPSDRPKDDAEAEPASKLSPSAAPATHMESKQSLAAASTPNPELAGLNKNQRKKLRKKQKLLAQQAA